MSMDMFGEFLKTQDQLERERIRCLENDCDVRKVFLELRSCNERVTRRIAFTAETCHQEMIDLMEAVDHCVKDKAFSKIR